MSVQSPCVRGLALLMLVSGLLPYAAFAKWPKLIFGGHPLAWGGSCEPGFARVLAGSHYFLRVVNTADTLVEPLSPGWPEGYVLEAGLDLPHGTPFAPTPGLIEQMEPTRILSIRNIGANTGLHVNPAEFHDYENLNAKNFGLTIPTCLIGHTVRLRAVFESADTTMISEATQAIWVTEPCDRDDIARIVASFVYEAWMYGTRSRVIELADSMLACGLTNAEAWKIAVKVAISMRQYDKADVYSKQLGADQELSPH
jgi:hypothetical protein